MCAERPLSWGYVQSRSPVFGHDRGALWSRLLSKWAREQRRWVIRMPKTPRGKRVIDPTTDTFQVVDKAPDGEAQPYFDKSRMR